MKNVLLLAEKKVFFDVLEEFSPEFRSYKSSNNTIELSFLSFGLFVHKFQKNIPYAKFPLTLTPEFKPIVPEVDSVAERNISKASSLNLAEIDEIIIFADYDFDGAFYASLFLDYFLKGWRSKPFYFISSKYKPLKYLEEEFRYREENREENIKEFDKFLEMGEIKKYFDYNYILNSQVFFKEILNSLKIKSNINVSKYMILLLHLIKDKEVTHCANIQKMMEKYKGTGKYSYYYLGIGTPVSYGQIIYNLIDLGFLNKDQNNVKISDLGLKFLSLTTKKTFDPDLSGRIWYLMNLNKEEALKKIDLYINTVFKNQKRKNKYLTLN